MEYLAALLTVHNRRELTLRCLMQLNNHEYDREQYTIDTFMTDDGCTDGTADAVASQFPNVHIIDGDGTLYWNRGMLKAWQAAANSGSYDYYLWINDDTFLLPNSIINLIEASKKCEDKSLIVGTTCAVGQPAIITYGGRTHKGALIVPNGKLQECELINGNIVLIPKQVYDRVGMNDPIFQHAIGDNDYGYRVIEAGMKNYVAPTIIGECNEHLKVASYFDRNVSLKNRIIALRKPGGLQPEEFFQYEKRHFGIMRALFHYLTTHIHVLAPALWGKR